MPRFRFLDPSVPAERAERESLLALIDAWWAEFERRHTDLDALFKGRKDWDLPAWMHTHLQAIDGELMWEFGPGVRGQGHRLVVTPEAARHLRPLVDVLLARAPKLPGWEFFGHRVPEDVSMAERTVKARTGGNLSGTLVRVERGEHHLVNLTFLSPGAASDDSQAQKDAFVASETLLGEEVLDHWIGAIEVVPLPQKGFFARFRKGGGPSEAPAHPLSEMLAVVERAIAEIRDGLARTPHHARRNDEAWALIELKPEERDDYPEQLDLFAAKTMHVEQWKAAHGEAPFYDERFSATGETFAYVKLDGSGDLDKEKFADKGEIEDALDSVLVPAGLGCFIGGGTGLRYSYVDLALSNLDRGIAAVIARLREGNVSRRTWIQFFRADWKYEWVGVYPDSPPPPLRG